MSLIINWNPSTMTLSQTKPIEINLVKTEC